MTDRIPGAPGQYKATVTAAELEKMQAGEAFTITMTRDDQPIVEGTPYNKASVLPDDLAALICPGVDDPKPADAFDRLYAGKMSSITERYYSRTDTDETNLNVWLDSKLSNMPNRSAMMVNISCPAISGTTLYGFLFNHTEGYAIVALFAYENVMYIKTRKAGVWYKAYNAHSVVGDGMVGTSIPSSGVENQVFYLIP